jgi:hypothetical protein
LLDSSPSPRKVPLPPKIHPETESPIADTRKRKEPPLATNQPTKSHSIVKNNSPARNYIEEATTPWPVGNGFLIKRY